MFMTVLIRNGFTQDTMYMYNSGKVISQLATSDIDSATSHYVAQKKIQVTDVDGNIYNTVTIGKQIWMAENLRTTKYRNGTSIGTTTPDTLDFSHLQNLKYQWAYNGNESNVSTYGRLYTWYTVTDSLGICPIGWHLPSKAEWVTMKNYLIDNGYNYDDSKVENKLGISLASKTKWDSFESPGTVGYSGYQNKRNATGFNGYPAGARDVLGPFLNLGVSCSWWSQTEDGAPVLAPDAWLGGLYIYVNNLIIDSGNKSSGCSVRCIKD